MSATDIKGIWDIEDVLGTSRGSTGVPILQIGNPNAPQSSQAVTDNQVTLWGPSGFVGFPAAPVNKKTPQVVVLKTSHCDVAIAVRDVNSAKLSGAMKMGETTVYAPGSMARTLYKLDGSITHYTTDNNKEDGQSIFVSIAPDGIKCGSPWGALTITSAGVQIASTGGAWLLLGSDGNVTLGGTTGSLAFGSTMIGMLATKLTPATYGPSGMAAIASTSVFISV